MYPEDYSSIKTKFYLKKYLPTHFKQTILCLTHQKEIIKKVPLGETYQIIITILSWLFPGHHYFITNLTDRSKLSYIILSPRPSKNDPDL